MSEWFQSDTAKNLFISVVILAAAGVLAALARTVITPLLRRLTSRTDTDIDDIVLKAMNRPIVFAILLGGLYFALLQLDVWTEKQVKWIQEGASVAAILLLVYTILRVFNSVAVWLTEAAAEKSTRGREVRAQSLVGRKVVNIIVLVLGILMILSQLDVKIGPILAGLGLGGLAVALALQDTLSNLFAGIYMMVDKPVAVGDFVKLESGEEGFIEEIGWRNTKVRMWANNIVIIPNSKLSQSVLTNYYLPQQELSVYINCGVAYDSDLEHVERVCVEVGEEVMARVPGCQTEWTPVVRFKEFADFSINFLVVLRVKDFAAQYLLAHEYMKALHRRFNEEGIEIPFPIRTVIMHSPERIKAAGPAPAADTSPGIQGAEVGNAGAEPGEGH
ncbi:MAG: mechanosensitive ion channel family protein [Armatimonadetes bacterium]|nr:mechanosensitive ion channel family protein [Armatimonadota bacterium]